MTLAMAVSKERDRDRSQKTVKSLESRKVKKVIISCSFRSLGKLESCCSKWKHNSVDLYARESRKAEDAPTSLPQQQQLL